MTTPAGIRTLDIKLGGLMFYHYVLLPCTMEKRLGERLYKALDMLKDTRCATRSHGAVVERSSTKLKVQGSNPGTRPNS